MTDREKILIQREAGAQAILALTTLSRTPAIEKALAKLFPLPPKTQPRVLFEDGGSYAVRDGELYASVMSNGTGGRLCGSHWEYLTIRRERICALLELGRLGATVEVPDKETD